MAFTTPSPKVPHKLIKPLDVGEYPHKYNYFALFDHQMYAESHKAAKISAINSTSSNDDRKNEKQQIDKNDKVKLDDSNTRATRTDSYCDMNDGVSQVSLTSWNRSSSVQKTFFGSRGEETKGEKKIEGICVGGEKTPA